MKHTLYIILAMMFSLSSCTIEHSENGDLDGLWQLTQIENLADNTSADMRQSGIYWQVQHNLLETVSRYAPDEAKNVFFRFQHTGSSLLLSDPYIDDRTEGDTKVDDVSMLSFYYIDSLTPTFDIEHLSSGKMTLKSDKYRFFFRKY